MQCSSVTCLTITVGNAVGAIIRNTSVLSLAICLLDNNVAGVSIVALSILPNRLLSTPVRTATGGVGEHAVGVDGGPAGPDSMFMQNSVIVGDNASHLL